MPLRGSMNGFTYINSTLIVLNIIALLCSLRTGNMARNQPQYNSGTSSLYVIAAFGSFTHAALQNRRFRMRA